MLSSSNEMEISGGCDEIIMEKESGFKKAKDNEDIQNKKTTDSFTLNDEVEDEDFHNDEFMSMAKSLYNKRDNNNTSSNGSGSNPNNICNSGSSVAPNSKFNFEKPTFRRTSEYYEYFTIYRYMDVVHRKKSMALN
jgi:hypothetical protein